MNPNEATFCALTMKLFAQLRAVDSNRGKILLVSSARPQEGKSFIASVLARTMSTLDDEPVALIDANLSAPTLHSMFGLPNTHGFAECLASGSLSASPVSVGSPPLAVLPMGPGAKPGSLFKVQRVSALFEALRARYSISVIDADVLPDTGAMPHLADGVVMVVDASRTRREVIQGVLAQVNVAPEKMLGALLNKREQYIPSRLYRAL